MMIRAAQLSAMPVLRDRRCGSRVAGSGENDWQPQGPMAGNDSPEVRLYGPDPLPGSAGARRAERQVWNETCVSLAAAFFGEATAF